MANIHTKPGCQKYLVSLLESQIKDSNTPILAERMEVQQLDHPDEDIITVSTDRWAGTNVPIPSGIQNSAAKEKFWCEPCQPEGETQVVPPQKQVRFTLSTMESPPQREDRTHSAIPSTEARISQILYYNSKFHHIPFKKFKKMVRQGVIPKYLAATPTPVYASCMYARAKRRK